MQRSILTMSIFLAVFAVGFARPLRVRAESTDSPRRIINVEQNASGDALFVLEGWTCSSARDFIYVPADILGADRVLSVLLAAFLSHRPVLVTFSRNTSALQCNLESVIIQ